MIALGWNAAAGEGALRLTPGGGLAADDGLGTCVLLSLFLDRRATADDGAADRRGWLGDALAEPAGDRIGSRLWLLAREKQLPETLRRAEDYAAEALAWLVEDGLAEAVEVTASAAARGVLRLRVTVRPGFSDEIEVRL